MLARLPERIREKVRSAVLSFLEGFSVLRRGRLLGWVALGITLIVSTIVGGIVFFALLKVISKAWGEPVKITSAFLVVFLINIINFFGILGLVASFLPSMVTLILPLIIWIVLVKVFFFF